MKPANIKRELLLVFAVILGFVFIVSFSMLYVSDAIHQEQACGCFIPIPYMILLLSSLGVCVGLVIAYVFLTKFSHETREISKSVQETLNFLEPRERMVFREIIKHPSGVRQGVLEQKTGLHKATLHRVIHKLEDRGVVNKQSRDKVNILSLPGSLKKLFIN